MTKEIEKEIAKLNKENAEKGAKCRLVKNKEKDKYEVICPDKETAKDFFEHYINGKLELNIIPDTDENFDE